MTAIIQPNPYAPRPMVMPELRFAVSTLGGRYRVIERAVAGLSATTAGKDLAIQAIDQIARDLPALRRALETV